MKSLEPPNSHHLLAASGWLELGDNVEANKELENISEEFRTHPDVMEVRWQICAKESKWEAGVEIARAMTNLAPLRPDGWLHLAYALRRAPGGGLEAVWNTLLPAAEKFPKEIIIPFNLACYAAQLKRLDSAREWLRKANERSCPRTTKRTWTWKSSFWKGLSGATRIMWRRCNSSVTTTRAAAGSRLV